MHFLFNASFVFLTALSAGIHTSPTKVISDTLTKVLVPRETYVSQIPSPKMMVSLYSDILCTPEDQVAWVPLIYDKDVQQFQFQTFKLSRYIQEGEQVDISTTNCAQFLGSPIHDPGAGTLSISTAMTGNDPHLDSNKAGIGCFVSHSFTVISSFSYRLLSVRRVA